MVKALNTIDFIVENEVSKCSSELLIAFIPGCIFFLFETQDLVSIEVNIS